MSNKTVLIVDDDKEICELLNMFLTLEKYDVVSANTGMEGLEKFRSSKFDLILLDISLPDINGQQLCKLIRQESDVPVIMVSANDSVSDKVICLEYGADDYISKPFENMELMARIKAVLRRAEKHITATENSDDFGIINFQGLKIDYSKRHVTASDDTIINLTPKEFELLIYFAKHAGETLNRDTIIEDLWGKNTLYRWSRSLDVHIQNLRQKIEKNPKNPSIIQTVSGIGYKIAKQGN
ncbi:MAG: response regulator transcription factor [Candidatus Mucispirillum faecigallinarum]|uniref:Phosphate regulon transcriptional regulatory protein PhoB n=1 Tax=Candidatus Mucispirillum faecigallinarum TaxID=2838699 RepID=A0A9D2KB86_9BACT|nr:response regulator transcription factor [Candidatus Mucispirillum faecigallinarum]HIZ88522.1 response regulator transcription factor [Candidatus Mucispirillum faecigallinarum]